MAQWDITANAGSTVGDGDTGQQTITEPVDFDGATINSVTVLSSPSLTSDSTTNDTIRVRWHVTTDTGTNVYGAVSTLCFGELGDTVSSTTIAVGSAPNPAPTTAVGADWDELR
jgi:hypothetical protein